MSESGVEKLKPWYAVAQPHEDIKQGRLSEAVFAADLWSVVQPGSKAPEVYSDPVAFDDKTFVTAGMANVMKKVSQALSGEADAGDRIFSLQTSFGGGKTHTLVALWHMARHGDKLRRSRMLEVVGQFPKKVKGVAVFTNNTCDATKGRRTPEGVVTHTLWGELALQLGGTEAFRKVEEHDKNQTVPQGLFADILRSYAPCLILLDEIADYCVRTAAVKVGKATLADLTISFLQELQVAVDQVKGAALVATLPASHLEVASSELGQEILSALERKLGRMSADIKPVADEEIYEVVRRRLFESLGEPDEHKAVADAYMKMYSAHKTEVPAEAAKATYRDRIVSSYPFHPALIDALYLRWGSHGEFQRTRGVLRLLASIVGDLWNRRKAETQSQYLIQPCHLNWKLDALHAALTRLWGAGFDTVVPADVVGRDANSAAYDEEHGGDYATEKITQGLAASILLGSFGATGERSGYSTKDLKLCVSRPGLNWNYTDSGLLGLEERAFHLRDASAGNLGKRYWFGTSPGLNKLVVHYKNQLSGEDFSADIMEKLREQAGRAALSEATWRVIAAPDDDLPEQRSLALLVLPPDCVYTDSGDAKSKASPAEQRILKLSQKCGSRDRTYRNTLLFLVPAPRGLSRLRTAFREVAALEGVKRDYGSQLDAEQQEDLKDRLDAARKSAGEATGGAYAYVARVEGQAVSFSAIADPKASFTDHLKAVWRQVTEEDEWVLRKTGGVTLKAAGMVPADGGLRVKDAIDAFLRYTDKPMIASRGAVVQGLIQACRDKLVGIGRGTSLKNLQKTWCGEAPVAELDEDGVWIIPPFETPAGQRTPEGGPKPGQKPEPGPEPKTGPGPGPKPAGRAMHSIRIGGDVPVEHWADLFTCFVNPGVKMRPKKLRIGVEFDIELPAEQGVDESDPAFKSMQESARQLGLDFSSE